MRYKEKYFDKLNAIECTFDEGSVAIEKAIDQVMDLFREIRAVQSCVYFIGNGGSAGIAIHMSADYLKNGGIRTHSMHDAAVLTCLGNDYGYEFVFIKQLEIVADPGDLLVAISSSGNSPNVVNAAKMAKEKSCKILTFTGFKPDNQLRKLGDYNIYVPSMEYGIVESIHNMILQQIIDALMEKENRGDVEA